MDVDLFSLVVFLASLLIPAADTLRANRTGADESEPHDVAARRTTARGRTGRVWPSVSPRWVRPPAR
jgi:hypothetical protein